MRPPKTVSTRLWWVLLLFLPLALGAQTVRCGADRLEVLLPKLSGKNVGLVGNHTSIVGTSKTLLPDTLQAEGVRLVRLFSPEHGFRGTADAGAKINSSRDTRTGLPIVSLYGKHRKPTAKDLAGLDLLLFDLQDVGARFYTYISTLHYVMEAAAESGIPLIVLDRPNPCDHVAGPIRETSCTSFVGVDPLPLQHGLTMGELAKMINGEGWLKDGLTCQLEVVQIEGWEHGQAYSLPVPPSPNIRSDQAIKLYASLCLFEATRFSVGRGTSQPFTVVGYPDDRMGTYPFIPRSMPGATAPKHQGKKCYGESFAQTKHTGRFSLDILWQYYTRAVQLGIEPIDREQMFDLLAGTPSLRKRLQAGHRPCDIEAEWEKDLRLYIDMRRKYLLYSDNRVEISPQHKPCCL